MRVGRREVDLAIQGHENTLVMELCSVDGINVNIWAVMLYFA